ncbi:MAG: hypothetical protein JXP34_18475 [Planctomycetes bacterium]|nr:hypothetical protein [Planctomycetota bacterium]
MLGESMAVRPHGLPPLRVGVVDHIAVGVRALRLDRGRLVRRLSAVDQAIAIGIRRTRVRRVDHHLVAVRKTVAVGVGRERQAPVCGDLGAVGKAIPVRVRIGRIRVLADFLAVGEAILVRVRRERIRAALLLVAIAQAVAVRVGGERIRTAGDLLPIAETVAVGVRIPEIGPSLDLVPVEEEISVPIGTGIAGILGIQTVGRLHRIGEPIPVGVGRRGRTAPQGIGRRVLAGRRERGRRRGALLEEVIERVDGISDVDAAIVIRIARVLADDLGILEEDGEHADGVGDVQDPVHVAIRPQERARFGGTGEAQRQADGDDRRLHGSSLEPTPRGPPGPSRRPSADRRRRAAVSPARLHATLRFPY